MSTLREKPHLLQQAVTELSRVAGPPPLQTLRRAAETEAIKNDPAVMTALQRSTQDIEEGRTHSARKVFDDLGW
jgi:hypothetical protein